MIFWIYVIIALLVFGFTKAWYRTKFQAVGKDYKNLANENDAEEYFLMPICTGIFWPGFAAVYILRFAFTWWTDGCTWILVAGRKALAERGRRQQLESLERQKRIEELEKELEIPQE
jgi:hypothetical protein